MAITQEAESRSRAQKLTDADTRVVALGAAVCGEIIACGFCEQKQQDLNTKTTTEAAASAPNADSPLSIAAVLLRDAVVNALSTLLESTTDAFVRVTVPIACKVVCCLCASGAEDEVSQVFFFRAHDCAYVFVLVRVCLHCERTSFLNLFHPVSSIL